MWVSSNSNIVFSFKVCITNFIFCIFFFHIYIYIYMCKNLSAKYYQENKERLHKKASERHQNRSTEEKEKRQQYKILPES